MSATRPLEDNTIEISLRSKMDNAKQLLSDSGYYNGISDMRLKEEDPIQYELLFSGSNL